MGSSNKIDISRFDPTNASDDQIRLWLFAIIQAELEKDDAEVDQELIDECSDCEAFLSHNNPEITREEYAIGLARIKAKAQATQAESPNVTVQTKPKRRRFMRGAVFILAATLAVTILSVSVVAAFNGSAAWEFIMANIKQIVGMEPGESLHGEKVTLVKGDLVAEYDSVEDALKAGGFEGMLYPTAFPEGIRIERIIYTNVGTDEKYRLNFVFNTDHYSLRVFNYQSIQVDDWNSAETFLVDNVRYTITYMSDVDQYQAICYYNGFDHIFIGPNYDDLISILNSMEETR